MPLKDPIARKEWNREYNKRNKEKKRETNKLYRANNIENIKEYQKEYQKEYSKTPNGKKSTTISSWKKYGLIHDNYEELYDKYLDTTECDVCKYVFDKTNWRCMDHDHETNLFRQFLCFKCNVNDNWKKLI